MEGVPIYSPHDPLYGAHPADWRLSLGFIFGITLLGLWTAIVHARADRLAAERTRLLADDALEAGLRAPREKRGGSAAAT